MESKQKHLLKYLKKKWIKSKLKEKEMKNEEISVKLEMKR